MSQRELQLQRAGYVAAFRHPELVDAIGSGPLGRVAVFYVEWAGSGQQTVVAPWTILSSPQSIEGFANRLAAAEVGRRGNRTAISTALLFAAGQFSFSGVQSLRRTIDVSGDGIGDDGPPISMVRDQVIGQRITVNGLSITSADNGAGGPFALMFDSGGADVHAYYRNHVIGGPGAFAIAVTGFQDLARAVRRKLILEIAAR